jgi:prolyl-tRNA editing enzyme YbaK/EbsC (Cys-tRNA(Pro) deacylase)
MEGNIAAQLKHSAGKVQDALTALGLTGRVLELPESTRTAAEAARAIGCDVGQIVKSLVFKGAKSDRPVLVVASGVNRVNEKKIAAHIGEPLAKADADFVRTRTGYAIGGVPPLAHKEQLLTLIDSDLLVFPMLWAAAGTPNAVFRLTPLELVRVTAGTIIDVKS